MEMVRQWGFELVPGPHLTARHRYTAGTALERGADLAWAMTAPDLDGAWLARGGFGTVHILSDLPWDDMDGRPVLGFSDATALFCAMAVRGIAGAIHAPVLHSLADHVDAASQEQTRRALKGLPLALSATQWAGPDVEVEGPVVGGNLCMLASLAGTEWALRSDGCILVIEDIGEPPYKVDRLLTQLRLSGALDGVAAIGLGEFSNCSAPKDADWQLRDLLLERLQPLGVPIWGDLPTGHGHQNQAWYHGSKGRLGQGCLRVETH